MAHIEIFIMESNMCNLQVLFHMVLYSHNFLVLKDTSKFFVFSAKILKTNVNFRTAKICNS